EECGRHPFAVSLEELEQVEVRAHRDDQLGALLVRQEDGHVLADTRRGQDRRREPEPVDALAPGGAAVGIGVDDELGAALERLVRDRVHVAHDHVRLVAGLEEVVGAAVDADEHGLEVADVRLDDVQVALHPGAAGHHEGMPVAKARLHLREPDPFGKELRLVTKVPEGVLGEALERLGDAASLLGQFRLDVRLRQGAAGREPRAVAEEARAADDEGLAVPDLLEEIGVAVHVDEPDPAAHQLERPGVREAPAHRGRDVDDDAYVRGEKLLRGHAVEVAVVDDRDVVRPEAPDEALRPLVEPRVTRELPEAHCWTASMNSAPPSILSTSSLLADSAKRSMRVWVGSPGTFSTRKWVSAALAIWGRWVIVSTCARSASLPRASATACAVRPPMPASISSKTIVGSPAPAWATARRASATRESSPPEAVSATGANGR